MSHSITHAKSVNLAKVPDPTQAQLDAQIALGNYPAGTLLADIALGSDFNAGHVIVGLAQSPASSVAGQLSMFGASSDILATANFLAGYSTAAPNATVPVASFSAYGTDVDIDLAFVPKGTGGFMLTIPDDTVVGGNKRGSSSIDLQIVRVASTQVASGFNSLAAGVSNTASGLRAAALGYGNIVSATSSVAIGEQNNISNQNSVAAGFRNTVTSRYGAAMGYQNNVGGYCSSVFGYRCLTTVAGSYSIALGVYARTSATMAVSIGVGVSNANPLNNSVARSIWFAANSTVPSLAVWNGGGTGLYGKVSIGSATEPTDSCAFEVVSTTRGSRPHPRMTTAQRDAIAAPSTGLMVYNTSTSALNLYTTSWGAVGGGGGSGDMILAANQTVTGQKSFLDGTMRLANVSGTFVGVFVNTNTVDRIYTLKDAPGTIAFTSDITGTNSGTNTGDNSTNTLYSGLVSNATHTGDAEGATSLTVKRINGVALSGLGTGLLKNTTTTGVPSIALNSDLPAMSSTVGGAVPTPPNNTITFLRGDGTFANAASISLPEVAGILQFRRSNFGGI